jgi:PAS domain S-box-containing protein
MPFLLLLDIISLSLALALSTALLLIVGAAGIRKSLNVTFVLFALSESGWGVTFLLLRICLWLKAGSPALLLDLSVVFFALVGISLLLFAMRYMRVRGPWPLVVAGIALVTLVTHLPALFRDRLVHAPSMGAAGGIVYHFTPWGYATASVAAASILVSIVILHTRRRRESDPYIATGAILIFVGGLVSGILFPQLSLLPLTSAASMGIMGWGIMRWQLFNPLHDLTADLRERTHRQELISKISRRTATLLELDELFRQSVTLIQEAFDYFVVAILLVDGDDLVLRATTHPSAPPRLGDHRLKVGVEGICGWVAANGAPLLVGDVRREPRFISILPHGRTRSELAVPIFRSDKVIGVLDVQSARLDAFTEKDVLTQQTIADQLSSAIENARLYEETRRRAERLSLVNRISSAVGSVLDLDDLLEIVYREVARIFEADAFFIALYDARTDVLEYRIQVDEGKREPPDREPLGNGLTSRVVTTRRPLLANDLAREDFQGPQPTAWGTGKMPSSWIGVPMLIGERITGVMNVQTYRARHYDSDDLLLASTIADQVAIAVENARLYQEIRLELDVRLRTEKVLRESEEKFRNLAEQSPNMIFIRAGGSIVYANPQCETLLGWVRQELCSPDFDFRLITGAGYDSIILQIFQRHERAENVPPCECVFVARGGRTIDAILTTRLIHYEGKPAILGIVTDITARKRTERLLQSLNAATLAMEQALTPAEIFPSAVRVLAGLGFDSAVFLVESDSAPALRTHCRGGGRTAEVTVTEEGHDAGPLLRTDQIPEIAQAMDGHAALFTPLGGGAMELLFESPGAPTRDGLADSYGVILAPLAVGDAPFGLLAVSGADLGPEDLQIFTAFTHQAAAAWRKTRLMRDLEGTIRQLRQTQEQLLQSQKMEAIGRLAGGIAHDFNNLLTVISGYTSLLSDGLEDNAAALADLGQIRTTIKRASALTSRLLAFGRKQMLRPTILDLNKVVSASVTLLRPLIGEDIELVVRLCPGELCIRADHAQIDQVLMNLAVNARDAMPRGGRLLMETGQADVGPSGEVAGTNGSPGFRRGLPGDLPSGTWAILRVQDFGVGMTEDIQVHVFEPFFTTKEEGKGTGLGLSTVYGIVTQSGGGIRVESAVSAGSTFTVFLPHVPSGAAAAADEEQPQSLPAGSGTVLLVEDETNVRELARKVLERGGYTVMPVASAREALLVAEGNAALDLVVTDIVMPGGMSGIEMGERLARTRPRLPILYMSGYTDDARFRSPGNHAALPFLSKPFRPDDLLARVKDMVEK